MKSLNLFKITLLSSTLFAAVALADNLPTAPTQITSVNVTYSQAFYPVANGGMLVPQAIMGGNVIFTGQAPIYVTVEIGGQNYTQLTDAQGNFSFFVYTNGAAQFTVNAWANTQAANPNLAKTMVLK